MEEGIFDIFGTGEGGENEALGEGINKGMATLDAVAGFASSFAPIAKDLSIGTADRMSDRGEVTHKTDVLGNTMGTTLAGVEAGGKLAGPIGSLIGGGIGLAGGLVGSLIGKKQDPSQNDILNRHKEFDMGLLTKTIRGNDTLPVQAQAAEHGMDHIAGVKQIEVERDEIVLRKVGNTFKKVADFKGGKTHDQGGEPFVAQEGDIIFPGKKRAAVNSALRLRNWKRLESMRQSLPADNQPAEYAKGTKKVSDPKEPKEEEKITKFTKDTRKQWEKKYGSDTAYFLQYLDKTDIASGKKLRDIVQEVSEKSGVDANFLLNTALSEGLDSYKFEEDYDKEYEYYKKHENEYEKQGLTKDQYYAKGGYGYKSPELSGVNYLGLDTFGNVKDTLIKKGYLDKQFVKDNVVISDYGNELGQTVQTGDFKDLTSGLTANAAFIKNMQDNVDSWTEEQGLQLSPDQRMFFHNVAYNAGEGNAREMMQSYQKSGFLENDDFLKNQPSESWSQPYKHAIRRYGAMKGFNDEGIIKSSYYRDNKVEPVSQLASADVKPVDMKSIGKQPQEGLAGMENFATKLATQETEVEEYAMGTSGIKAKKYGKYEEGTSGIKTSRKWSVEEVDKFMRMYAEDGDEPAITAEELIELAEANDFPLELALIQGAVESGFGTKGAGEWTNNIYNWGNVTAGDKKTRQQALKDGDRKVMDSVRVGVDRYMKGVKKNYLDPVDGDWRKLIEDGFVNKDGKRYATDKKYEKMLRVALVDVPVPDEKPTPEVPEILRANTGEEPIPQVGPQRLSPEEEAQAQNDIIDKNNQRQAYLESLIQSEKAIINNATPTGKAIRSEYESNIKKDVEGMSKVVSADELPEWLQVEHEDNDWGITSAVKDLWNKFPGKAKRGIAAFSNDFGGDRSSRWGKGAQEQRFADTPEGVDLREDARQFHNFLQEQLGFFKRAGVELDETFAIGTKILFGKTIEASDMRIDADIASQFSPEQYQALIAQAKKEGILQDDYSEAYAYDLYKNPERYYSVADEGQLAMDVAMILNPRGWLQLGKTAVKGGKAGVKGAVQVAKYTKDNWKNVVKKAPALAKKAIEKTIDFFKDKPMYRDGEGVFDALEFMTENGTKIPGTRQATYQAIKNQFTRAKDFLKDMPSNMREKYYGRSVDDILDAEKEIQDFTGKSWDEIGKMSKEEIGAEFKRMHDAKLNNWKKASNAEEKAWDRYWSANKKATATPNPTDDVIQELRSAEQDLLEATAESARTKPGDAIILGSEDDMLKYTNEKKAFESKLAQVNEKNKLAMDKIENPDNFQLAIREQKTTTGSPGWSQPQLGEGNLGTARLQGEANAATKVRQGAEDVLNSQKAFEKKFPDIANMLKKDEKLRAHFRRGVGRGAAALDALTSLGIPKNQAQAFVDENVSVTEEGDIEVGTREKQTAILDDKGGVKNAKGEPEASIDTDLMPDYVGAPKIGEKPEGKGGSVLGAVGAGLEGLAKYAPAIYNISRGLQQPDKVKRNFVSPHTLDYVDLSDPQRRAIDTAFNASLKTARNLSGGLVSNYRANTESAWADRIARLGQVNAQEVGRSQDIANMNSQIKNQADAQNTQIANQAEAMDMQSKAATNSFLAQGMQDVANIASVNQKDRNMEKNQNLVLNLINSGRDFSVDPQTGEIKFNK